VSDDELKRLKAERDAADREYNAALTRVDAAIQRLPANFPHPPPPPDAHQSASIAALWRIDMPPAGRGLRGRIAAAVRRIVGPLFEQQQAFNSAVADHIDRNVSVQRETQRTIESTLTVLRDQLAELVRFESVLVMYLQQITPYVDTRDRDVAGLLRGLSAAIDAVSDELMKRSEGLLARDGRRQLQLEHLEGALADLRLRIDQLRGAIAGSLEPPGGGPGAA